MNKRVVITGIGSVTPLGNDSLTTWENIKNGVSGIEPIKRIDTEKFTVKVGGEVKDFAPEKFMDMKESRRMARFTQFAVAASKMAINDSIFRSGKMYIQNALEYGLVLESVV